MLKFFAYHGIHEIIIFKLLILRKQAAVNKIMWKISQYSKYDPHYIFLQTKKNITKFVVC